MKPRHRSLRLVEPPRVRGVFQFYETHGLPLDDILSGLWQRSLVPDWLDLVCAMTRAGRPLTRTFETIIWAANDACYPIQVRDAIVTQLKIMRAALQIVPNVKLLVFSRHQLYRSDLAMSSYWQSPLFKPTKERPMTEAANAPTDPAPVDTPTPGITPAAKQEKKKVTAAEGEALLKAYEAAKQNQAAAEETAAEAAIKTEERAKAIFEAMGEDEFFWNGKRYRAIARKAKLSDKKSYYLRIVEKSENIPSFGSGG